MKFSRSTAESPNFFFLPFFLSYLTFPFASMDQRRPSISEGSVASEDLASKDLPSRSYFSSHAQPDISMHRSTLLTPKIVTLLS